MKRFLALVLIGLISTQIIACKPVEKDEPPKDNNIEEQEQLEDQSEISKVEPAEQTASGQVQNPDVVYKPDGTVTFTEEKLADMAQEAFMMLKEVEKVPANTPVITPTEALRKIQDEVPGLYLIRDVGYESILNEIYQIPVYRGDYMYEAFEDKYDLHKPDSNLWASMRRHKEFLLLDLYKGPQYDPIPEEESYEE